jgi:hypothetical protein
VRGSRRPARSVSQTLNDSPQLVSANPSAKRTRTYGTVRATAFGFQRPTEDGLFDTAFIHYQRFKRFRANLGKVFTLVLESVC